MVRAPHQRSEDYGFRSKYEKVGVLPKRTVKCNVSSIGPSSYRQYAPTFFIFLGSQKKRFVFLIKLFATLINPSYQTYYDRQFLSCIRRNVLC